MAEEDYDFVPYKDISELKKELEAVKGRRDVSTKELYDAVQHLAQTMNDIVEVFGAAAEQMNLEEKERESDIKKHEIIISKLDKLIDQNRTIAEGMVAIVEMIKEKVVAPAKEREGSIFMPREDESLFKPKQEKKSAPEPNLFMNLPQQDWKPKPEPMMPRAQQQMMPPIMPPIMPPMPTPDFGAEMPPMGPVPSPDFDFPEDPFPLEDEPKKKGLFGMFKK